MFFFRHKKDIMSSNANRFFARLKSFLLYSFIGLVLGGIAAQVWGTLTYPAPVEWKWNQIQSPYKFKEIVAVSETRVWLRAENGLNYAAPTTIVCNGLFDAGKCSWEQSNPEAAQTYVISGAKFRTLMKSGCQASYNYFGVDAKYPNKNAGTLLECAPALQHAPSIGIGILSYYALMDNGDVWMLRRQPMEEMARALLFAKTYLICMAIGLAIGIYAWHLNKTEAENSVTNDKF